MGRNRASKSSNQSLRPRFHGGLFFHADTNSGRSWSSTRCERRNRRHQPIGRFWPRSYGGCHFRDERNCIFLTPLAGVSSHVVARNGSSRDGGRDASFRDQTLSDDLDCSTASYHTDTSQTTRLREPSAQKQVWSRAESDVTSKRRCAPLPSALACGVRSDRPPASQALRANSSGARLDGAPPFRLVLCRRNLSETVRHQCSAPRTRWR